MKVKRIIVGIISVVCLFVTLGIIGGIENGAPISNAFICIPTLAIFIFNCWLLGVID